MCISRRICNPTNHNLAVTLLPAAPTPHQTHPSHHGNHLAFCVFFTRKWKLCDKIGRGLKRYNFYNCLQKYRKQTLKYFRTVGWSAVRSNYVGEILRSFTYIYQVGPALPHDRSKDMKDNSENIRVKGIRIRARGLKQDSLLTFIFAYLFPHDTSPEKYDRLQISCLQQFISY